MKLNFSVPVLATLVVMALSSCGPTQSPVSEPPSPTITSQPSAADLPSPTATSQVNALDQPSPTATFQPTATDPPSPTATTQSPTLTPLELTSGAFMAELPIPVRHACHGENLSPPLAWSQPPQGTQSLVLIMDDPDAVSVAGFVWDHWLLFNIPPDVLSISEGVLADAELPDGSHHGQNSFKQLGYGGPCPPSGQIHRYVFTLYALDTILALEPQVTKDEILEATSGHILGQGELVGTYKSP